MKLVVDEDVPLAIANFFKERGHQIISVVEDLMPGTSDSVVAAVADREGATVVTFNHRDFKKLIDRTRKGGDRLRFAGRICLLFERSQADWRLPQVHDALVWEHDRAQQARDQRVMIEVNKDWYRVHR